MLFHEWGIYQVLPSILKGAISAGWTSSVSSLEQILTDQQTGALDGNVDDVWGLAARHLRDDLVRILRPGAHGGEVVDDGYVGVGFLEAGVGVGVDLFVGIAAKVKDGERGGCILGGSSAAGRRLGSRCTGRQERARGGDAGQSQKAAATEDNAFGRGQRHSGFLLNRQWFDPWPMAKGRWSLLRLAAGSTG